MVSGLFCLTADLWTVVAYRIARVFNMSDDSRTVARELSKDLSGCNILVFIANLRSKFFFV